MSYNFIDQDFSISKVKSGSYICKFIASFDIDRYAYAYLQKTNDSFECRTVFIYA